MYFWCGGRRLAERALSLASSKVINFVGVEIARDLGLGFFLEAKNNLFILSTLFYSLKVTSIYMNIAMQIKKVILTFQFWRGIGWKFVTEDKVCINNQAFSDNGLDPHPLQGCCSSPTLQLL